MSRGLLLGLLLGLVASAHAVVAFWWWALFGMNSEIGVAHGVTVFVVGTVGIFIGLSEAEL